MVRRAEVFDFENNLGTEVLRGAKRARMTAVMAISEASDVFESENRVGFAIEWLSVIEMRERPGMGLSRTLYTQEKGKQEPAGCGWFSIRRTKVFVRCLSGCRRYLQGFKYVSDDKTPGGLPQKLRPRNRLRI
jgi:hypothetical protein